MTSYLSNTLRFAVVIGFCSLPVWSNSAVAAPKQTAQLQFVLVRPVQTVRGATAFRKLPQAVSLKSILPAKARVEYSGYLGVLKVENQKRTATNLVAVLFTLPASRKRSTPQYDLFLKLFSASNLRTAKQWHSYPTFNLTPNLPCLNGNFAQGEDVVTGVDARWLELRQPRTLLLHVKMSGFAFSGVVGADGLVVFSQGLTYAPKVQCFENWGNMNGTMQTLFKRNTQGTLEIQQQYSQSDMKYGTGHNTLRKQKPVTYIWNGQKFASQKTS